MEAERFYFDEDTFRNPKIGTRATGEIPGTKANSWVCLLTDNDGFSFHGVLDQKEAHTSVVIPDGDPRADNGDLGGFIDYRLTFSTVKNYKKFRYWYERQHLLAQAYLRQSILKVGQDFTIKNTSRFIQWAKTEVRMFAKKAKALPSLMSDPETLAFFQAPMVLAIAADEGRFPFYLLEEPQKGIGCHYHQYGDKVSDILEECAP